ncbi:MAG: DNA-binding response regulator [Cytophagia bacterium]|nr:DNA-binding response regulator [Cytophagia bacterium]NBW34671.1 DNA-binding response regulator [Cytophagia bacterium]
MEKLLCAIIDDDDISLSIIEALALKTDLLEVKATFNDPMKAIAWLSKNEVDLLILDIEMPTISGLEMFRSLPVKPAVIIVSGKAQYAVEAFDLAITDYLLKPVNDYARFLTAVNKVLARRGPGTTSEKKSDSELFVKSDSLLLKLNLEDVLWVEASGDYVKIQTSDKTHVIYATLKKVEEKLDPVKFVRVHRSYIVNLSKISNIDINNLEINKRIIPISGTYRDDLLSKISIL